MSISRAGTIAIIIIVVAAVFGIAWGVAHRLWYANDDAEDRAQYAPNGMSQQQYMREVRVRHQEDMAAITHTRMPRYDKGGYNVSTRQTPDPWGDGGSEV